MSYDDWRATPYDDGEDERPIACPVCTGDEDATCCSEQCRDVYMLMHWRRTQRANYQRARGLIRMARRYQEEAVPGDRRIRELMTELRVVRAGIASMRRHITMFLEQVAEEEAAE